MAVLKEQLTQNSAEHLEIRKEIAENKETLKGVAKDLNELVTNHIVFKTKVLVWFAIGAGVLSALINLLVNFISKRI